MDDTPHYSYPSGVFARLARDTVLLRHRDFHQDAKACIQNLRPPLRLRGEENVPQQGPCVITVNHYHRPGFGAEWLALAVAAIVPVPMHWIMTGEWTHPAGWLRLIGVAGSCVVLKRIAHIYGFTTMPPMPPRPEDVQARAAAVRAVLEFVKRTEDPILGLAPEGCDPPGGVLTRPAPGLGRFGLLLSRAGLAFLPAGAYEEDGSFHLRFGERYLLRVGNDLASDEKDQCAMQIIMKKIADLLPRRLRGEFA
jgi:hypothetical protein